MTMKPGIIEEVQDGVFQLEKVLSSGWGMTMTVVRLTGPDLLVYSPVWIDDQTFAQLAKVGRPKVLVAPNHFHHLSLRPFTERYPDAMVIASPVALPRLLRKGYQGLRPGAEAEPLLPQNLRFVVPEGTRNGEVWLSLSEANGRCTWVIADAFFNVTRPVASEIRCPSELKAVDT